MAGFRITSVHAFVIVDDNGDEGIPAFLAEGQWFPLIAADQSRLKQLRPIARQLAEQKKRPVRLLRFDSMEEVEVLNAGTAE